MAANLDATAVVIILFAVLGFSMAINVMLVVHVIKLGAALNETQARLNAINREYTQHVFQERVGKLHTRGEEAL